VAHACNPSYSGGRNKENQGSKSAQANSSQDPISKMPITKRAGGIAQGEDPEFKTQYRKKQQQKKPLIRESKCENKWGEELKEW
jgi:hypothetical protein